MTPKYVELGSRKYVVRARAGAFIGAMLNTAGEALQALLAMTVQTRQAVQAKTYAGLHELGQVVKPITGVVPADQQTAREIKLLLEGRKVVARVAMGHVDQKVERRSYALIGMGRGPV